MLSNKQEEPMEEILFWREWLEADLSKRIKLVENCPIIQEFLSEIDNPVSKNSFVLVFNSLFEDLESTIYSKLRHLS